MNANAMMNPTSSAADGVRDALAQLVEMLEERHPAFAGRLLVVTERREPSRLRRQVLLVVVTVLTWEWN